jgi:hypothetical protein
VSAAKSFLPGIYLRHYGQQSPEVYHGFVITTTCFMLCQPADAGSDLGVCHSTVVMRPDFVLSVLCCIAFQQFAFIALAVDDGLDLLSPTE